MRSGPRPQRRVLDLRPSLLGLGLVVAFACDVTVNVGEPLLPPSDAGLAPSATADGEAPPVLPTWRRRAPTIPCSAHAMAEARADRLYVGCNGGMLYRFDGTDATLEVTTDDDRTFGLVWVAATGEVWAAAQRGFGDEPGTASELHRFDGKIWSKVNDAPFGDQRLMAITGTAADDVWLATRDELFHFDGATFTSRYVSPGGNFRGCAFRARDRGYCGGTGGLAVTWDGTAWTPISGAPWTLDAEVLGVETTDNFGPPAAMFYYAEPASLSTGDHLCRIAKWDGAFTTYAAEQPCFVEFDRSRKRVGRVTVGGPTYFLLAPDETYGGALVFDSKLDEWRPLCGPILSFAQGLGSTRVGGHDGLLGTIVGSGGAQIAVDAFGSSGEDIREVSVATDGSAWARTESSVACNSVTERVARFERGAWAPVPAPQWALSGRSLAAVSFNRAYTFSLSDLALGEFDDGDWRTLVPLPGPSAMWARRADAVWVAGDRDDFGRFDGERYVELGAPGRRRQIEQIVATDDGDAWMVATGYTQDDTDTYVYRFEGGKLTEWNLGLPRAAVTISALDRTHAWRSGSPAQRWDGEKWKPLSFDATGVWARSEREVFFAQGGDIARFDGQKLERVYRGFVHIRQIDGFGDRGFAVGSGGLTVEFSVNAEPTR